MPIRRTCAQPQSRPRSPLWFLGGGLCALVLAVAGVSGCSDGGSAAQPSPSAGAGTPGSAAGGSAIPGPDIVTLRARGFSNGPDGFPLPRGLSTSYSVDNPNNVTLVIDVAQGPSTYEFLRSHLPAAGYTITADAHQSLTFAANGWSGAYTVSAEVAALTLRTDPSS